MTSDKKHTVSTQYKKNLSSDVQGIFIILVSSFVFTYIRAEIMIKERYDGIK